MKKMSKLLLMVLAVVMLIPNVLAVSSKYDTVVSTDGEITNGEFYIILGYEGENVLDVNLKLGYDSRYLELLAINPLNDYDYEDKDIKTTDDWRVKEITVYKNETSEYTNYCMVLFKMTDKFKVGKAIDIFLYDQVATGEDEYDYKDTNKYLTVRRSEEDEITLTKKEVDFMVKAEYWVRKNSLLMIFFVIIFVVLLGALFIIPTSVKRESRAKKIRQDKARNSKKVNYNINSNNASNNMNSNVDAFNGNAQKNDYKIDKNQEQIGSTTNSMFSNDSSLGVINPTDFSDKKDIDK